MNERELARWLMDLAACYNHVPQKAAIARYLRILSRWKLSPEQWDRLGDLAVLRLTRRFPMPGELQEIATELREEADLRANSQYLSRMRDEWHREAGTAPQARLGAKHETRRPRGLGAVARAIDP